MRIVLQIVKSAHVELNGENISEIGKGFVLLVGFTPTDNEEIVRKMAEKVAKLRIFPDESGKTNLSLSSFNGEVLSVSQFTVYASAKNGNRPDFISCMNKDEASKLYQCFLDDLRPLVPNLKSNVFHTDCQIHLINDGPFTLILDSKELFGL